MCDSHNPDEHFGEEDSIQEVCPKCASDNISNEGPPEDDGRLAVTCFNCGYQWMEPSNEQE